MRCPPVRPGTTEPVRASSCDHFTTLETATPNRSATTRQVDPKRTAATTRSRRSVEYALVILNPPCSDVGRESQKPTQGNPQRFRQTMKRSSLPVTLILTFAGAGEVTIDVPVTRTAPTATAKAR